MERRNAYDHEPAYRKIAASGGRGWDDWVPGSPEQGSYRSLEAFLAGEPPPPPGARALELGCGGGQAALRVARAGYSVTGIDFSETAIELAQRNAADAGLPVTFLVGDCLTLEQVPSGSLDLVVDNHMLHCLVLPEQRAAVLRAVRRVLRPGGRLWSETMSREGSFRADVVNADPATGVNRSGTRIWTSAADLDRELAAAGLRVVRRTLTSPDEKTGGCDLVTLAEA
jgi:2-polyprenyl-3-methyl-5-hydroxy-6-metoxy-1,4-benzoquinol methylase